MTPIDINPIDLKMVQQILREKVPELEVRVFGSRVSWTARETSDLDLVLMTKEPLDISHMANLKESFSESNLPFRVDILDWADTSENFRKIIKNENIIIQEEVKNNRVAKNGWKRMSFGEAVLVNPSVVLKRGKTYPFVNMADINPNSKFAHAVGQREYSGSGSHFQADDTLMARITPCLENGKIACYSPTTEEKTAHGSTEFIIIRGRPEVTDTEFAYYLTRWKKVRNHAVNQMTGTSGRQRVPVKSLCHIRVPVPPLHEQRLITHVLGTLDHKIELNRHTSETLEAMVRALFKSWFVDFDPVRAKMEGRWQKDKSLPSLPKHLYDIFPNKLVDSEYGQIPNGWQITTLGNIAKQIRKQKIPTSYPNTLFEYFSIPAFDDGQTPKPEYGKNIKSSKLEVFPKTVLISKLNPEIERVWLVDTKTEGQAVCSTEFLVLSALSPFTQNYVYCLLRSHFFQQRVKTLVTGTSKSHQRARANDILALDVVVPPAPILEAFDKNASKILDRTLTCRRESNVLRLLRETLLPMILSGKVRLNHPPTSSIKINPTISI